MTLTRKKMAV
jgi:hypothetical protein